MAEFKTVESSDGKSFEGWMVEPKDSKKGAHGAVVFLAEAYNVNAWARASAQSYADEGFLVLAPDLYWRQQPRTYMEYSTPAQGLARALYAKMNFNLAVADTVACMDLLKRHPASNGRVGLVGFCLGGKIAFLTAARERPNAAVGYYSIDLDDYFQETSSMTCSTAFHFGALDQRAPVRYASELTRHKGATQNLESLVYDKAGHGFARFGQPCFEPDSARMANDKTLELFHRTLD